MAKPTKKGLIRKSKNKLVKMAEERGLRVLSGDTKSEIADAILAFDTEMEKEAPPEVKKDKLIEDGVGEERVPSETEETRRTKGSLMQLTKKELLAVAKEKGIKATKKDTKSQLSKKILDFEKRQVREGRAEEVQKGELPPPPVKSMEDEDLPPPPDEMEPPPPPSGVPEVIPEVIEEKPPEMSTLPQAEPEEFHLPFDGIPSEPELRSDFESWVVEDNLDWLRAKGAKAVDRDRQHAGAPVREEDVPAERTSDVLDTVKEVVDAAVEEELDEGEDVIKERDEAGGGDDVLDNIIHEDIDLDTVEMEVDSILNGDTGILEEEVEPIEEAPSEMSEVEKEQVYEPSDLEKWAYLDTVEWAKGEEICAVCEELKPVHVAMEAEGAEEHYCEACYNRLSTSEGGMFECPVCGAFVEAGETTCPHCGVDFE